MATFWGNILEQPALIAGSIVIIGTASVSLWKAVKFLWCKMFTGKIKSKQRNDIDMLEIQVEEYKTAILAEIKKFKDDVDILIIKGFNQVNMRLDVAEEKYAEAKIENKERNQIVLRGVQASLEGLQELGANGSTGDALKEIKEYKDRKSS